jgi:hypothetical protein
MVQSSTAQHGTAYILSHSKALSGKTFPMDFLPGLTQLNDNQKDYITNKTNKAILSDLDLQGGVTHGITSRRCFWK